jgi:hypothetical protein
MSAYSISAEPEEHSFFMSQWRGVVYAGAREVAVLHGHPYELAALRAASLYRDGLERMDALRPSRKYRPIMLTPGSVVRVDGEIGEEDDDLGGAPSVTRWQRRLDEEAMKDGF